MRAWAGMLAIATVLGAAAPATAAEPPSLGGKPFLLTTEHGAQHPDVAVDDNGTGHFAWNVDAPYPQTDPLVYCQVPRGATACQHTQRFPLPLEAFGNAKVLIPSPGTVILLTYRGYGTGEGLYAVISTDGGATFAAPKLIADGVTFNEAAYGPGENAVSVTDDVVGSTRYQAAPLDGYTEANAQVGQGGDSRGYDGSIAFPNPETPLVAFDDLDNGYYRLWGGKGDVNDLATWGPTQSLGPVTDLRLATGIKGVVLMGKEDISLGAHKYTARRFDTASGTFGAPQTLSDPKQETDVIFRDIFEDGGGNIAAVFIANGVYGGGKHEDPMRYRASTDGGKTWGPEKTLVDSTSDAGFHLQLGAAPDGGGFVVFDNNDTNAPLMKAVAVPTLAQSGAGGGSGGSGGLPCQGTVSFGDVQAIATAGCLQKQKNGSYTTHDPVRLNGLDLVPHGAGGRRASAAAEGTITVDPVSKKVHIDAADVKAGPVVLDKGNFDWDVKSGATSITTFAHLEKFDVHIFGFPVTGEATLKFDKDGAFIPAHLELPKVFGGVTGDVTLRLKNPGGLKLEGFKIHVGEAFLGALKIKPLDVEYKGSEPPLFEGSATFLLPPSYSAPGAHVSFGFVNGQFKHAEGSIPFDPALALSPPWVYLKQIGLALSTDPLQIAGGVQLIGGPEIFGKQAVSIDALPPANGFSFTFSDPAVLRISGAMSVVDVPFAHGFVEFRTSGLFKFGGGLDFTVPLGLASVTAGVPEGPPLGPGFVDLSNGKFNAPFSGDVCVPAGCGFIDVGSKGVISSNGIAACGEYIVTTKPFTVGVSAGFGYHWGGDADIFGAFGGCDVSGYSVAAPAKRRALGAQTVAVAAGLPQENIVVQGTTGAPNVTVAAPDGESVGTPGKGTHIVVIPNAAAKATLVMIGKPVAGTYTITPASGSSPIAKIGHADGLPDPQVTGKVGGSGYARTLSYTIKPITGQTVRFLERSAGAGADLGAAKGTNGTLHFTPADGPKGTRQIVADVAQNGLPRRQIVVATYVAPGPRTPGKPRFVHARRAGASVKVRWGKATAAAGYILRVRLHDGTSRLYTFGASKRSFTAPNVPTRTFGSITVQAISKNGVRGPERRATVKKKPKKNKQKKRA